MSYSYDTKKKAADRANTQEPAATMQEAAPQSAFAQSAAAQSAHRVDLPDAMRAKMESAFGVDLSAVKLYESQAVADAGAEAVTQGSNIAFAPGKLDLASSGGQSLLGHELSHVVSQARGEVTGSGFLNDHTLEARADREGAMAAAGQQVYSGPVTGAMSAAAPAVSAAAPLQAKRKSKAQKAAEERAEDSEYMDLLSKRSGVYGNSSDYEMHGGNELTDQEEARYQKLNVRHWKRLQKNLSKDEFYDRVGEASSSDYGAPPEFARKWYEKYKKGRKGPDTAQELRKKQAEEAKRAEFFRQEEEERRKRMGADYEESGNFFI